MRIIGVSGSRCGGRGDLGIHRGSRGGGSRSDRYLVYLTGIQSSVFSTGGISGKVCSSDLYAAVVVVAVGVVGVVVVWW